MNKALSLVLNTLQTIFGLLLLFFVVLVLGAGTLAGMLIGGLLDGYRVGVDLHIFMRAFDKFLEGLRKRQGNPRTCLNCGNRVVPKEGRLAGMPAELVLPDSTSVCAVAFKCNRLDRNDTNKKASDHWCPAQTN